MPKITRILTVVILIISSQNIYSQNKELTLEDAVLKQYSSLSPEHLKNLQWIADTEHYSFVKDNTLNVVAFPTKKANQLVKLDEINKITKSKLKSFPGVHWINDHEFYFVSGQLIYTYDIKKSKGALLFELDEGAKLLEVETKQLSIIFKNNNNLFVQKKNGEPVQITEDGTENIVYGEAVHRFEFGISKGTFWSPSGNSVAYYRNDQQKVQDFPLVDYTVTPAKEKKIKYPMAGSTNETVTLLIYDLKTEKSITLQHNTEFDYLTNITWGPDDKNIYIAMLNRGQDHMNLDKFDPTTGKKLSTLFGQKKSTYVEPLNPMYFIPGKSDQFLWLDNAMGFLQIWKYNTEGERLEKGTNNEFSITSFIGFNTEGTEAYFQATGENATESHLYRLNIESHSIEKVTKEAGTHNCNVSSSGNYFIDDFTSLEVPHRTSLARLKGLNSTNDLSPQVLFNAKDPLADYSIGECKIFKIKSQDDQDLYCRMLLPPNFDESVKYPVIVYVYNGPHVQLITNRWLGGAKLWMYHMAQKGYIVFTVDGRGSYNRGVKFEECVHRRLGTLEIEDQMSGVEHLKTLPYVNTDKMAIHGWSYGGFMTSSIMFKKPDVFKVGVAGGPVTDWKFYEIMYTERYMDTPEENPEGYANAGLLDKVDKLEGKLLLIHGLQDDVVVPQQNFELIRSAIEKGVQLDFFPYPTHPHNVRGKDRLHLMKKVLDYIEVNLN